MNDSSTGHVAIRAILALSGYAVLKEPGAVLALGVSPELLEKGLKALPHGIAMLGSSVGDASTAHLQKLAIDHFAGAADHLQGNVNGDAARALLLAAAASFATASQSGIGDPQYVRAWAKTLRKVAKDPVRRSAAFEHLSVRQGFEGFWESSIWPALNSGEALDGFAWEAVTRALGADPSASQAGGIQLRTLVMDAMRHALIQELLSNPKATQTLAFFFKAFASEKLIRIEYSVLGLQETVDALLTAVTNLGDVGVQAISNRSPLCDGDRSKLFSQLDSIAVDSRTNRDNLQALLESQRRFESTISNLAIELQRAHQQRNEAIEELRIEKQNSGETTALLKQQRKSVASLRRVIASKENRIRMLYAELAQHEPEAVARHAYALVSSGRTNEAVSFLDEEIEREERESLRKQAIHRLSRARILLNNSADWQNAARDLDWCLANAPPDTRIQTADFGEALTDWMFTFAKYREMESLSQRLLTWSKKQFGNDHANVAVFLNNRASLLQMKGQYDTAEPLLRQALKIGEQTLGPNHPAIATRLNNLALLLKSTNRYTEAELLMRRALQIDEACLGPRDPGVSIDLNNLGQLLHDSGRYEEAEPLMRRALEIDTSNLGPKHLKVAIRLSNLARLLRVTGRTAEAKPLAVRAVDILDEQLGPNHPSTLIARDNLEKLLSENKP